MTYIKNVFAKTRSRKIIAVVLSMIILCVWAVYNKFPLLFNSDTAMYLEAAFSRGVRPDRPILYGLFMYYGSFLFSLWCVVVLQSLLVSLVVFYCFQYLTSAKNFELYFLGFVTLVSLLMGGGFEVCWLMPDVFIAISVLCTLVLLLGRRIHKVDLVILASLNMFSIAMHNSHFFVNVSILLALFGISFLKGLRAKLLLVGISRMRICLLLAIAFTSSLLLSSVHAIYGGGFKSSRGGAIFAMGSLVEMGLIDVYLAETCGMQQRSLCAYRDSIPNNFLWASNSPLYKTGGWEQREEEYSEIVMDLITTPKYLKTAAYKSLILTFKQFFLFDTGEAGIPTPRVNSAIMNYYRNEYRSFIHSRQNQGDLSFEFINFIQILIVATCILIYVLAGISQQGNNKYQIIIGIILFSLVANAWFCSTFSGVYPRYQSRLIWLVPLPLFLYAAEHFNYKRAGAILLTVFRKGSSGQGNSQIPHSTESI